jgi:predicted RNA-binding Zn-ribbon protein involved in translation (DUF1610 family)
MTKACAADATRASMTLGDRYISRLRRSDWDLGKIGWRTGEEASLTESPELRAELLLRLEGDQAARRAVLRGEATALEEMVHVDQQNSRWLAAVLDEHGWPGRRLVGDDRAHAAWLIAQHADHDPPFQRRCLDLVSAAVREDDAAPSDRAYLTDRVQLKELGYQTYGTQYVVVGGTRVLRTVKEPEALEERRRSVGLPPLAEQDRAMTEHSGPPKAFISTQRPILVRCPNCGRQIAGQPTTEGQGFQAACPDCGWETTIRTS